MQYYTKISADYKKYQLNLKELLKYRDLIFLFVRRDFKVRYAQTILGPLWLILTPILTSFIYLIVFGGILGVSVSGLPKLPFYLLSNSLWVYFSSCISANARVFTGNASLFGKVYFPRMVVPVANMLSQLVLFGIQVLILIPVLGYYVYKGELHPHYGYLLLMILVVAVLGLLGMSCGIFVSSLTAKYRDLSMLINFLISFLMYATPVIYTSDMVSNKIVSKILWINPTTSWFELSRFIIFGKGEVRVGYLVCSFMVTVVLCLMGVMLFNKTERTFMDTV